VGWGVVYIVFFSVAVAVAVAVAVTTTPRRTACVWVCVCSMGTRGWCNTQYTYLRCACVMVCGDEIRARRRPWRLARACAR